MSARGKTALEFVGRIEFAVPIHRASLRDRRLSFAARGIFAYIWDLPFGWQLRLSHLSEMSPDGRDAIRSRLAELEKVGAIKIEPLRDAGTGRVQGKKWVVFSPHLWAEDSGLCPESTEERVIRSSVTAKIGEADTKVLQGTKVLQKEAALEEPPSTTSAKNPAAAPAKGKQLRIHPTGIECWDGGDWTTADRLAADTPPDDLAAAIAAVRVVNKYPVPGTVAKCLRDATSARDVAARVAARAAQEASQERAQPVAKPTTSEIDRLPPVQRRIMAAMLTKDHAPPKIKTKGVSP